MTDAGAVEQQQQQHQEALSWSSFGNRSLKPLLLPIVNDCVYFIASSKSRKSVGTGFFETSIRIMRDLGRNYNDLNHVSNLNRFTVLDL